MKVELIGVTKPVELEFGESSDLLAYCARVSSSANQDKHASGPRLLNYLVRNQEWSPFEMCNMVIEVETTRDVARQILRHRSFSFQEFSQRYAVVEDAPVLREARMQDKANRQNSLPCDDDSKQEWWGAAQEELAAFANKIYREALDFGIAKEVARAVLPEGLTPSRMYINGTVRSWIHYTDLRCQEGTQKEHREVATAIRNILHEQFPALATALSSK